MGLGWLINSAMVIVAAAVFFEHGITVDSLTQASATLEPLAGSLARLLFGIGLLFAGLGSSFTSAMAEVNVLTAYLGRPEDPRTKFYRIGLFVLAIPALAVIAAGSGPAARAHLQPGGPHHPAAPDHPPPAVAGLQTRR